MKTKMDSYVANFSLFSIICDKELDVVKIKLIYMKSKLKDLT